MPYIKNQGDALGWQLLAFQAALRYESGRSTSEGWRFQSEVGKEGGDYDGEGRFARQPR